MNLSLYISRRLSFSNGTKQRTPVNVVIAVIGVALAIIVMELTLAIVFGFKTEITRKVMGFDAQVAVLPAYDYKAGDIVATISLDDTLKDAIHECLPQASVVLTMKQPGVLKTSDNFSAIVFKASDDKTYDFEFEKGNLVEGEIAHNDNTITVSTSLARQLNLGLGDKIDAYFFVNNAIKARRPRIVGFYESNFGDYDNLIAYAPLGWLQDVAAVDSITGTRIELRGLNNEDITTAADLLQDHLITKAQEGTFTQVYPVDNVRHTGAMYFSWLDLLDTNVVMIFILMACVSGFTLISSLFILILERIKMIGLLRSLGMTKMDMRQIFVYLAIRLVIIGMIVGNVIGLGIIFAQYYFEFIPLNPDMYYLNSVPVLINKWHIVALNVGVIVISWAVLILPSHLAATISPAKTMRYE